MKNIQACLLIRINFPSPHPPRSKIMNCMILGKMRHQKASFLILFYKTKFIYFPNSTKKTRNLFSTSFLTSNKNNYKRGGGMIFKKYTPLKVDNKNIIVHLLISLLFTSLTSQASPCIMSI